MKSHHLFAAAAAGSLCTIPCAHAAITFYDLFYTAAYTQTTSSPPLAANIYYFASRVIADNPSDLTGARLSVPPASVLYTLFPIAPGSFIAVRNFASEAAMTAEFPAGSYNFSISGGGLGSLNASISRPASLFLPSEIPAFDQPTFDLFAGYPSQQEVTLGFNGFALPPGANLAVTFLTVVDANDANVFNDSQAGPATSFTIPPGTLQPGATYRAALYYSARLEVLNAGFGAATSFVGCDRVTTAVITTAGVCVGDLNTDGFVDDTDFTFFAPAYDLLDCADPAMPVGCPADLNADAFVDDLDFVIFAAAYNELLCP